VQAEVAGLSAANQTSLLVGGLGVLLGMVSLAIAVVALRRKPS
jgi:hypothetical protein